MSENIKIKSVVWLGIGIMLLLVAVAPHKEEIQVIRNLPEGGNCEVRLDLYNEEDTKVDDEVHVFTVPRGEDE